MDNFKHRGFINNPPKVLSVEVYIKDGKYHIEGIPNEPMSKQELALFLQHGAFKIPEDEIGIMFYEFNRHPHHRRAYFEIGMLTGDWSFQWTE